jgi:choline dehydrogenase
VFKDHLLVPFSYEVLDGIPTAEMINQPGVLDWALQEWKEKGAGPLATGVTGTAFLSFVSTVPPGMRASRLERIAKLLQQDSGSTNPGLAKQLQLQKEVLLDDNEADLQLNYGATGVNPSAGNDIAKIFTHSDPGGYAGIVTALTHAFSRGSIHIKSSDAKVHPAIDPRYLSHPIDLELLSAGLLFTQQISSTKPLADLLKDNSAGDGKRIQPTFKLDTRLTEAKATDLVKEASASSFHPVGTCSMLPREDGGVVDPSLKVYGTENVRVVDASIIPLNVRGNITSLVYAIAERAADLIKRNQTLAISHRPEEDL